jgi:hypothetical protein
VKPTVVYDAYWRFAAARQLAYHRRLSGETPYTDDPIIAAHRFTNAYRAADRVSQYLIREVQYGEDRSQEPVELFFRTMLFKIFNKIETWQLLESKHGPMRWINANATFEDINSTLNIAMLKGDRVYSAAYIMPSPAFKEEKKHSNHLRLLAHMIFGGCFEALASAKSLKDVYETILSQPGIGPFLAFQYAIDLNYSTLFNFDEAEFVVAGPGALDGVAKCFEGDDMTAEEVIMEMYRIQDREFERLGLEWGGLFGRRLQPIDCQNLFCEISKYARVAYPDVKGKNDRTKIKQTYKPHGEPMPTPFFPPKWNIEYAAP